MHVASVTIFKPASPQDDLFARFREHTAARLDLLPSYRRRLEPTPLGIDHPAWVVEDKLDLDYHIRHAALPKPGGMDGTADPDRRSFTPFRSTAAARCGSTISSKGWRTDAFAVYIKVHHSTMDGVAGMATLGVTYDFAPGAEHESAPQKDRPSRRRAVRFHRAHEHSRWRFHSPGLAGGEVAAGRRQGADQGRAAFRPRRALSLQLREGHAAHAVQQGDLCSSRLCDLVAAAARRQGARQVAGRDDQRRRAGALRWRSAALSRRTCRAAGKAADRRRAGFAAAVRQRAAQQPGRLHPLPPADRRRASRCRGSPRPRPPARRRRTCSPTCATW